MMEFTLSLSGKRGSELNTFYPKTVKVTDQESLAEAAGFDHVCGTYRGSQRSNGNFLSSDVIPMDADNEGSDDPESWMTPEKLSQLLPDVSYAIVYSKSHMKRKEGKGPRPRFHVYFDIPLCTELSYYSSAKKAIHRSFPFFDANALDASRFLFGVENPQVEIHEGWLSILDVVTVEEVSPAEEASCNYSVIPEGRRNSTLSRFAGRVLKRYGDTERAEEIFRNRADRCDPPLDDAEVAAIWRSAKGFFRKRIASQEGYVPPEEYNEDFRGRLSLKPEDYSDIGQARVLAEEYGGELIYTEGTDYLRYDGNVWNETRQQAVGAAEEFLDLQLAEAETEYLEARETLLAMGVEEHEMKSPGKNFLKELPDEKLKAYTRYQNACQYLSFVMKRRDMKYITSALQAAKPMLEHKVSELDADGFLLNTPGATYDLRLGMEGAREPRASDLLTRITDYAPSDEGEDLWNETLSKIFMDDADLISYVQRIAGLAAIGKVYVEALIISYGTGSNGKSTFWNTVARVLGTYSCTMSADSLTVGCRRNVKPEMAELKGRRLVIASELEEGMRLNTSVIKQLCSTDEVQAEKKYKDPFHFTPSHTLVLYTNHLPRVGANDPGTWRRLIVIPFNAVIKGNGDIKNFSDHLCGKAGGAVMKWIIEGAEKVIAEDFRIVPPKCVCDAVEAYRESCDWLNAFLTECCETGTGLRQKSGELYQEYRAWAMRMGEFARSTSEFYAALENAGFERKKTREGVYVLGLTMKEDFLE